MKTPEHPVKSSLDTFVMEDMVRDNIAWMIRVEERLLKDSAMAEDAVQEAFVSAFRGFDSFQNHYTKDLAASYYSQYCVNEITPA